jgi:hypothetical protein
MRRKQSMQHFDQRQLLLLENAYYQVGKAADVFFFKCLNMGWYSAILLNVPRGRKNIVHPSNSSSDT